MKTVNWIDGTYSKAEHMQRASGTRQGETKNGRLFPEPGSETRAAVISRCVASGPPSPDAHYPDTSLRTEDAKERRRKGKGNVQYSNRQLQRR